MTRRIELALAALVGVASVLLVLLPTYGGEAVLHQLHDGVGHHALHLFLPGAAVVIFAALVARDVSRHGWPTLSWKL